MKIISYKHKKNNLYEIYLSDNNKYTLYDDVILKYELLLKKEINDKELKSILLDNNKIEAYYKSIKYITTKLRTEKEIRKKLIGYEDDIINYVIERLYKEGYLNNDVYLKSYINDSINLKTVGPNKIIYELKKLGFDGNIIYNYISNIDDKIWISKINKYIQKRINKNHTLSGLLLKNKITKELYNYGFLEEHINMVINEYSFNDDNKIYEKEYLKIKNKLSKKYSGNELEYMIKINMQKKGFKSN